MVTLTTVVMKNFPLYYAVNGSFDVLDIIIEN